MEKSKLLNFKNTKKQTKKLEQQIDDFKAKLPAHSVSPAIIEEPEELEKNLLIPERNQHKFKKLLKTGIMS